MTDAFGGAGGLRHAVDRRYRTAWPGRPSQTTSGAGYATVTGAMTPDELQIRLFRGFRTCHRNSQLALTAEGSREHWAEPKPSSRPPEFRPKQKDSIELLKALLLTQVFLTGLWLSRVALSSWRINSV